MKLARIFGDNMVLQRRKPIAVFGEASDGTRISVELGAAGISTNQTDAGQLGLGRAETLAKDGRWLLHLPLQEAARDLELVIKSSEGETIVFSNVAIGEVWLAGGQSNMQFPLRFDDEAQTIIQGIANPDIRFYDCPRLSYDNRFGLEKTDNCGFWRAATPENLPWFSAVGFFFEQALAGGLGEMPIAVVGCNLNGSPASAWLPEEYFTGDIAFYWDEVRDYWRELDEQEYLKWFRENRAMANSPEWLAREEIMGSTHVTAPMEFPMSLDAETMKKQRRLMMSGPLALFRPSGLYEFMLKPIIPYTIAGAIWYQGEAETDTENPNALRTYDLLLSTMITAWRELWQDDFPFLFVQLPPFEPLNGGVRLNFVPLREKQERVMELVEGAYMACLMDSGARYDIHPKSKRNAGDRLARLALGEVYGLDTPCWSPKVRSVQKTNGSLTLFFDHAYNGLQIEQGDLACFELFVDGLAIAPFTVEVRADTLIIHNSAITERAHAELRFAQKGFCTVNLYNSAGLPALPFSVSV